MCADGRSGARAFTLIELMVVIVLIGVVTAIVIPEMHGTYEDALLRSTARQLVSLSTLASSQAVTGNRLHRLRLDSKEGRYTLERKAATREEGKGFAPVKNVPGAAGELDKRIKWELRPLEDASEQAEPIAPQALEERIPAGNVIQFYPDGTADGTEILLRDREGFSLVLRLNATTARMEVQKEHR